jgi:ABC-type arginine/histidine transport system permease subunit
MIGDEYWGMNVLLIAGIVFNIIKTCIFHIFNNIRKKMHTVSFTPLKI